MSPERLRELHRLLYELESGDFHGMPGYTKGEWSRRNLSALRLDVQEAAGPVRDGLQRNRPKFL